jgi:hypothetical protein
MAVNRLAYAQEANDTIQKLVPIGGASASGTPAGFLGTVTNAFIPLLAIAIHQSGKAQIHYPPSLTDPQFEALVVMIHRAYYTSILTAIEGACDDFARSKGLIPAPAPGKKGIDFAEYLEAALSQSGVKASRKTYWRKYFNGLRILRNKCSHFRNVFESSEKLALRAVGLKNHIGPNDEMQTQPANYAAIAKKALAFLREL